MPPQDLVHTPHPHPRRVDPVEHHQQVDIRLGLGVATGPGAEQHHSAKPPAVRCPQLSRHYRGGPDRINPRIGPDANLGSLGSSLALDLPLRDALLDQSLVGQPPDRPALHAGVVERKPCLPQCRELQQRVFEAPRPAIARSSRSRARGSRTRPMKTSMSP